MPAPFETESEALQYANDKYPGAEAHKDKASQQWFVSLNEEETGAYENGPVLTRDFGPDNPSANSDNNDASRNTITGVSAFGIANGAKQTLIEQAASSSLKGTSNEALKSTSAVSKAFGKDVGRYFKCVKGAGVAGAALSSAITFNSVKDYYDNGGDNWQVAAKAGLDFAMTVVGFMGPIGFGVSATYFLFDLTIGDKVWNIPNDNSISP